MRLRASTERAPGRPGCRARVRRRRCGHTRGSRGGKREMKRILVATDGSVSSAEAARFGIELATEHKAELVFVHVVPVVDVAPAAAFGRGTAFPHEPSDEDRALLEDGA